MNLTSIMSFLSIIGPFIEPVLVNLEQGELQPELQKLIAGVSDTDLKNFLTAVDTALTSLINAKISAI